MLAIVFYKQDPIYTISMTIAAVLVFACIIGIFVDVKRKKHIAEKAMLKQRLIEYFIMREMVEIAFCVVKGPNGIMRFEYNPILKDYLEEYKIRFENDIADFLTSTKFHELMGKTESELRETINRLPFDKKIIFDYECEKIIVEPKE